MNVEMSQIILGIYELALRERLKNDGMVQFCNQVNCSLPYLVLPATLERYVAPEELYFLTGNAIPRRLHGMTYPERVDSYVGAEEHPVDKIALIGRESNFELYAAKNLMHSHYHELKVPLLVRDTFHKFLAERLEIPPYTAEFRTYKVLHSGIQLSPDEVRVETEIFMNAVLIRIAETMKTRYEFDVSEVRAYAYNSLVSVDEESPDDVQPTILVETMLRAISTPDSIRGQLAAGDYRLDKFNCKLCANLEVETMKFLAKAYELVYHEI